MNTPSTPTADDIRLIRLREVCSKTGLGKSSVYALKADGQFPEAVKLGGRMVAWVEAEVNQWVADRIASRHLSVVA